MSIEHLTVNDAGELIVPESADDWRDWVSATRTRNRVLGDPLLDWLELYGSDRGFERDDELPDYRSHAITALYRCSTSPSSTSTTTSFAADGIV